MAVGNGIAQRIGAVPIRIGNVDILAGGGVEMDAAMAGTAQRYRQRVAIGVAIGQAEGHRRILTAGHRHILGGGGVVDRRCLFDHVGRRRRSGGLGRDDVRRGATGYGRGSRRGNGGGRDRSRADHGFGCRRDRLGRGRSGGHVQAGGGHLLDDGMAGIRGRLHGLDVGDGRAPAARHLDTDVGMGRRRLGHVQDVDARRRARALVQHGQRAQLGVVNLGGAGDGKPRFAQIRTGDVVQHGKIVEILARGVRRLGIRIGGGIGGEFVQHDRPPRKREKQKAPACMRSGA